MEKLQAALSKARKQRQSTTPGTAARPDPTPTGADALWGALEAFDVPAAVLKKHRVVTQVVGTEAAPFDILRTKILVQMRKQGWRRLAITSPRPSSGKTTIACNLALGLGRQHDMRSVLLDLDLRDPSIHSYFETMPKHGIGELLKGQVGFEAQAMRIGENVAVSMARQAEADPTALLNADETVDVLAEIEEQYQPDLMVFDLPSVLVNDDTRAFLKNVDCALVVIRAAVTRYSQFDTCEREIAEQTNVLGTVLNAYMSAGTEHD